MTDTTVTDSKPVKIEYDPTNHLLTITSRNPMYDFRNRYYVPQECIDDFVSSLADKFPSWINDPENWIEVEPSDLREYDWVDFVYKNNRYHHHVDFVDEGDAFVKFDDSDYSKHNDVSYQIMHNYAKTEASTRFFRYVSEPKDGPGLYLTNDNWYVMCDENGLWSFIDGTRANPVTWAELNDTYLKDKSYPIMFAYSFNGKHNKD